jgi:hypothetical protein
MTIFVQGSKTFRKPSLKAHEKSDENINNCKREYAKKNPQGLESLSYTLTVCHSKMLVTAGLFSSKVSSLQGCSDF